MAETVLVFDLVITRDFIVWLRGATVARLTPDQKVACSNHVGVKTFVAM